MAICFFNILCLCNFSKAIFLIISISLTVNLDWFKISGAVRDNNNINDRSCLISSNKFEKKRFHLLI